MSNVLELDELSFGYGHDVPIFDRLSLTVPDGRVIAICGRSGIGKSTLLRLLGGHLRPDHGQAKLLGRAIAGPSADRPIVFQNHNLFDWLTAEENVAFGLRCKGERRADRTAKARALLSRMGILDAATRLPHQLSGGMQQRVGIARALAVDPACVLMDEPFSALDNETKAQVSADIRTMADRNGVTVIIITHDKAGLEGFADRVITVSGPGDAAMIQTEPASIM